MNIKKNYSEVNLKTGMLGKDKSRRLLTFQRVGDELIRPQPKAIIPPQAKKPNKILRKPDPSSSLLSKAISTTKFLPPLPEITIKKVVCREIDEYGRSLLQSDCQPSRTKEYKESDLINRSCSEDITSSQGMNIPSQMSIARNKNIKARNIITPRENEVFPAGFVETSTPTFRNSPVGENYMDSYKDRSVYKGILEEEEILKLVSYKSSLFQLPTSRDFSVKNSKMDSLADFPCYVGTGYTRQQIYCGNEVNSYQTHKDQRQNRKRYIVMEMAREKSNRGLKSHQRIKVINRGLPKDVFTFSDNHKYY